MIGMGFSQAGLGEALPGVKGLGASWPYGTALFELSCRLKEAGLEPGCGHDRMIERRRTGRELIRDSFPSCFWRSVERHWNSVHRPIRSFSSPSPSAIHGLPTWHPLSTVTLAFYIPILGRPAEFMATSGLELNSST